MNATKPQRHEFKGHSIEVRPGKDLPELLIDDVPVRYGRLPDGSYFLDDYAYDWSDDLVEVARRYIDYRERSAAAREPKKPRKGA
jgi:hypothetical protein